MSKQRFCCSSFRPRARGPIDIPQSGALAGQCAPRAPPRAAPQAAPPARLSPWPGPAATPPVRRCWPEPPWLPRSPETSRRARLSLRGPPPAPPHAPGPAPWRSARRLAAPSWPRPRAPDTPPKTARLPGFLPCRPRNTLRPAPFCTARASWRKACACARVTRRARS